MDKTKQVEHTMDINKIKKGEHLTIDEEKIKQLDNLIIDMDKTKQEVQ